MRRGIPWQLMASGALLLGIVAFGRSAWGQDEQSTVAEPPAASTAATALLQEVVVTGSRAISSTAASPTPITQLSAGDLQLSAPASISDALSSVPQFRSSLKPSSFVSPQSPVGAYLNLRGLSSPNSPRTLVLLDARRINPQNATGLVDVNSLPNLLIKRVDIVTGGASAAYGSDAVTGVVNYVLDDQFTGVKADMNAGISNRDDDSSQKAALAAGGWLLDRRLHLMGSVEYYNSDGITSAANRPWAQAQCQPIQDPTYPKSGPNFLLRCGVTGTDLAPGGVITSGLLKGTQFRPGGVPAPYIYGSDVTGSTMIGGDGVWIPRGNFAPPIRNESAFGHADFHVNDNFSLFLEAAYAHDQASLPFLYPVFSGGTAFTIYSDNAYLPEAIQSQMTSLGLPSITVGRAGVDWGQSEGHNSSDNLRGTAGFRAIAGNWTIDGYVDVGRTNLYQTVDNLLNRSRAYEAADAVIDPATGSAVCRSSLTNPDNGCAPLDIFGAGSASSQALSYIEDTAWTRSRSKQTAAELVAHGAPVATWAGKIQVAAGVDYRNIFAEANADPVSTSALLAAPGSKGTPAAIVGTTGGWEAGNQLNQPPSSEDVKEVFGEASVPLVSARRFVNALDLDTAIRYASYSTTGGVTSWKLGVVLSPVPGLRFRASRSRDVRAPNLQQLSGPTTVALTTGFDPLTRSTAQFSAYSVPNRNLKPEFGDTTTVGVVLEPALIDDFRLSLDYYRITVNGAIGTLSPIQVINLCGSGHAQYCQYEQRLPAPPNDLVSVTSPLLNLNELKASGIDFEADYRVPLSKLVTSVPGALTIKALVSYLDHLTTTDPFGGRIESAGVNGGENVGTPRWEGSLYAIYSSDPWTFFLQERVISRGILQTVNPPPFSTGTGPNSIDDNHVGGAAYTDITLGYSIRQGLEAYATVNNLLDRDPPLAPTRTGVPFLTFETNPTLYDVMGRYFTVGLRMDLQ